MPRILTIILAGGQGSRLYPLTQVRSKPAVPMAGRFRLIDFPLSNCIHSGLRKIFVLTQFSSESLHRHIFLTYRFDNFSKDFVTILSAQQTLESRDWYQGTADAVRQNLFFFRSEGDLVLILSGDHLYRMDYSKFIQFHLKKKAEVSVSVYPITSEQAPSFGVMKVNKSFEVIDFCEKPKEPADLERMRIPEEFLKLFPAEDNSKTHLASMGVYLFNWEVLKESLQNPEFTDFGRQVIPFVVKKKKVYAHFFFGYWADIGTIKSFFEANIALTDPLPRFNFYAEEKPIFTHARFLPGSKILASEISHSILCEGSIINRSRINHSIVGIRSHIGENSFLERVVMMGADYFESKEEIERNLAQGIPRVGVGRDCEIRNSIIDKNARVGNSVKLVNARGISDEEAANYVIRDGIIAIPKDAVIPDGSVI